jgi:hypothetical protein
MPQYRRALVSYIDVIGFSELVKSLKSDPDLAPRIHLILLVCWSAAPWENFPILLRGGICVGDISMDPDPRSDEIVFGPAMVRAYELERDAAVYPRIVIDRELIKEADASR